MQNQTKQPDFVSNQYRTITGQLAEWGIDFCQDRVAQLSAQQQNQLQTWINAGVDADEAYQPEFTGLPEFMENEILEMSGKFSSEPRETIIEYAINAYEAETPITGNPYLFDTFAWHLWRKAYCHWHRGETLEFTEEDSANPHENEDSSTVTEINQQLAQLYSKLNQTKYSLKKLRRKLLKAKRQRKALIQKQTQLIHQLCKSFGSGTDFSSVSSQEEERIEMNTESTKEISPSHKIQETQSTSLTSAVIQQTKIVRIPITGIETNRVEVYLQQNNDGQWRAGHLWSVEADARTGQRSRGSKHPDQQQTTYATETEALINEILYLSQGIIGVTEIDNEMIDYLNSLEEYSGQFAVCSVCHCHFIDDEATRSGFCPQCSNESGV